VKVTFDTHYVATDKPVRGITPARLPALGQLATLEPGSPIVSVGYRAQSVTSGKGGKTLNCEDARYVATGSFTTLTPVYLEGVDEPGARRRRHVLRRFGRSELRRRPRTSSRRRRSPATCGAARRTSTTGSTRRSREDFLQEHVRLP
jgi:hypothetical protein